MARILGIHGIAQQHESGPERTHQWWLAIRGGLEAANRRDLADALEPDDLRVVFFGGLFRPPGSMAGDEPPPFTENDIATGPEQAMLAAWYEQAVALEPDLGPPPAAMAAGGRPAVQVMADALLRSRTLRGVAKRAMVRDLKQVTAYLEDADVRRRVLEIVNKEMSTETRILVGHSLGSVIAYEYLFDADFDADVAALLTLGSPLGMPGVVFDRLTPPPDGGTGAWPGEVERWVNVADNRDFVALRKTLAASFGRSPKGVEVIDRLVDNGDHPHDARRYLNSRQVGEAVAAALDG